MTKYPPAPLVERATSLPALGVLSDQARTYLDAARSANTHRAYRADWEHFTAWCAIHELAPLPATPETLVGHAAFR